MYYQGVILNVDPKVVDIPRPDLTSEMIYENSDVMLYENGDVMVY